MNTPTKTNCDFPISDFERVKEKMLDWAQQFSIFSLLDNHHYQMGPHSVECMLAAGSRRQISANAGAALSSLQKFINESPSYLFGHLGYDLKNEIESLHSLNADHIGFPDLFFFEPEIIIWLNDHVMTICAEYPKKVFDSINDISISPFLAESHNKISVNAGISKDQYINIIKNLQRHILRGDCYEINFCQDFFSENAAIDPYQVYKQLGKLSPNPFSALYRLNDRYLLSASPERFLKKKGNTILSQPIKGTSKRIPENSLWDTQKKDELLKSKKDRSENVMVVDLVRNDLAKVCNEGTVKVDELFGVYSFPQVHQMISTVSGELKEKTVFEEIIRATFPMGSMTGAPKRRVMELIEQYEKTKRGIFSGALGYITPEGDFDFNVVIRSILYNSSAKYLSLPAGSGITFYSNPESEWEECLLKAEAMKKAVLT